MRISWETLRRTDWDLTLRVALTRGFITGIFVMVFALVSNSVPLWQALFVPAMWAIIAVPAGLAMYLIAFLITLIPAIGFAGLGFIFMGSIAVCVGDPVVYFLNKMYPGLLYVRKFRFVNFEPIIFILKPLRR